MRAVKNTLNKNFKSLNIEIFADLHLGDKQSQVHLIKNRIEKVRQSENTYCILVGDIIDNAIITSVGDTYGETLSPMGQLAYAIEMFRPIKDKILGVVSGNHENRTMKATSIDLMELFCIELGISDKYDHNAVLSFIRFGKAKNRSTNEKHRYTTYSLYISHGFGGGRTAGSKLNGLMKLGEIINSDIICCGHTHMPITTREQRIEVDYQNSSYSYKEVVFVNASATLGYGGYGERMGFKPSSTQSPIIVLDGTEKRIEVRI